MTARTRIFALRALRLCSCASGFAKSAADFYSKLKSCEEKAVAACFRLEFIRDGNLLPAESVVELLSEVQELVAIIAGACRKSSVSL